MTTKLARFSDAYATMTVAFYQPLTIRWVSGWTLAVAADLMAARVVKARSIDLPRALSTAAALKVARAGRLPDAIPGVSAGGTLPPPRPVDVAGHALGGGVKPINLAGFPDAVSVDGRIYPFRVVDVSDAELTQRHRQAGSLSAGALTSPTVINRLMGFVDSRENFHQHRKTLLENLAGAVTANIDASDEVFAAAASDSLLIDGVSLHDLLRRW